ncbi:potassium channel family protein [Dactylosporangium sp. CA-233914]|uniref:potassium channel family protein n=1 Tax=Dactylosporangium sp. CA-233914 TaxID=3239934 RepID=UPI003D926173
MSTPRAGTYLAAVLRTVLVTTAAVVWYLIAPLAGASSAPVWAEAVGGLALIGALVAWQVRAVLRSAHPWLRAAEALGLSFPLLMLLFATSYVLMSGARPAAFSERVTRFDALYFSVTVFATVGFGDIVPVSEAARLLVMVQMLADLAYIGLFVRIIVAAARAGVVRQEGPAPGEP